MQYSLIILLMGLLAFSSFGCTQESLLAVAGVTGLSGAERILQDLEGINDREIAIVLADRIAMQEKIAAVELDLQKKLAAAESEAQKEAFKTVAAVQTAELEKQIALNEKTEETLGTFSEVLTSTDLAMKTDWTDPKDVAPWGAAASGLIIALLFGKGKKKIDEQWGMFNENLMDHLAESPPEVAKPLRDRMKNGRGKVIPPT